MQGRNVIIVALAIALGLAAVFVANAYFSGVETRQEQVAQQQKLTRIVVAAVDLPFGTVLSDQNLKMVNWPSASIPAGAFTSLADAQRGTQATLRPIVAGEPVLSSKLSSRPTLSANLPAGQVAVAIPVSATAAAGGFVRPGDKVDVLLTRQIPGDGASNGDKMTDVILTSVPVLAIDIDADDKSTTPTVGKTATVQVDTFGAQKLALAQQLGVLSLALRNGADATPAIASTVLPNALTARPIYLGQRRGRAAPAAPMLAYSPAPASAAVAPPRKVGPTMTIYRGNESSEYEVPRGF